MRLEELGRILALITWPLWYPVKVLFTRKTAQWIFLDVPQWIWNDLWGMSGRERDETVVAILATVVFGVIGATLSGMEWARHAGSHWEDAKWCCVSMTGLVLVLWLNTTIIGIRELRKRPVKPEIDPSPIEPAPWEKTADGYRVQTLASIEQARTND